MRWTGSAILLVLFTAGGAAMAADWRSASRESAGIAPDPATTPEAVVQVYVARAWGWRGTFGVHSWISVKPSGAPAFTVYEVTGWRAYRGLSTVNISQRTPDGRWFGSMPRLLVDLRGDGVDEVIAGIDTAAREYPHADQYRLFPGPNSNTFVAHVGRAVPELRLDLPPTAIGKDFLPGNRLVARSPSGTGFQVSLFGLFGFLLGVEEGVEINILGMVFGIDFRNPAIKLPIVGRLGSRR